MSTYTKIKTLPLSLFNNAEYLSFMNHVLDLANGNSGDGDSESPDEISLLTGSDGIPELGLTKEFLETYEADLLAMADVVDESRISQETEQMTLHDTNRDNLAIYIITRISRAGTLPLEAERDAGKYLYKIIKPYNGIARLPMAQETAKIKGLLLDLRKDENKPYVTTLGLDAYLAELEMQNCGGGNCKMIAQRYKDMLSGKSVIRQISEWSTARGTEIGYENVFDYSLGNPSVPCPEHFTKTCIDLLQTKEPVTLHGYSPTLTIPAVRKAVAESLNRRFGMDYGMEHIFMATGAAGALAHAMRCVAVPGQDIITFAPFFPEYKPYVEGAGLNLKVVPPRTKDFQIDFDAFDAMLDENTAAVLINTPNNPSGAAYSAETLTGLADRLRAASAKYGHRIFLISDEPYREIMFGGQPIQYAAKFYDDTLTCYSFSKSLSLPGERIGYVAANPRCEDAEYIVPMCGQISRGVFSGILCFDHTVNITSLCC